MSIIYNKFVEIGTLLHLSIVGSVVECSPATRAARVRFPDDAKKFFYFLIIFTYLLTSIRKYFCKDNWQFYNLKSRFS